MRLMLTLVWRGMTGLGWLAVLAVVGPALMPVEDQPVPSRLAPAAADDEPAVGRPDAESVPNVGHVRERLEGDRRESGPRRPEVGLAHAWGRHVEGYRSPSRQVTGEPSPVIRATPAPNLHETHEAGEPYPYSLARAANNELRWTINEFRWRLGDPPVARRYWDLSPIDEPLGGDLPKRLEDLRAQNWELAWRAEQLHRLIAGLEPEVEMPPMPTGWTDVSIPVPT